jgi:DNA-binding response OmpR family regulator
MSQTNQCRWLVILVDDTRDCSAALEVALTSGGPFSVRICGSAEEALELMRSIRPAALVTDIHLPGMSGLALIGELKALYSGRCPAIIAVSGDGNPELETHAIEAGANAFFAKPYSPREVCRVLEDLIHDD